MCNAINKSFNNASKREGATIKVLAISLRPLEQQTTNIKSNNNKESNKKVTSQH